MRAHENSNIEIPKSVKKEEPKSRERMLQTWELKFFCMVMAVDYDTLEYTYNS